MDFHKPRYTPMSRRRRIYEGKAKVLYEGPEPGTLIQHFKDDATAFNAKKHEVIEGKGVLNNRISEYVFQHLNDIGVPTHFIRRLNMREQLIREVEIIPLEVVVRNVAAGLAVATRLGIEEGTQLPRSIIEFYYKNDAAQRSDGVGGAHHRVRLGDARRRSMTSWRSPFGSTISSPASSSASASVLSISRWRRGRLWENDMMRIVVADEISPEFLPAVGHQVEREARQGPFPPRPRRTARGLYRSRQAARHHERERAPAGHWSGAGQGIDEGARHRHAQVGHPRSAGQGDRGRSGRSALKGCRASVRARFSISRSPMATRREPKPGSGKRPTSCLPIP